MTLPSEVDFLLPQPARGGGAKDGENPEFKGCRLCANGLLPLLCPVPHGTRPPAPPQAETEVEGGRRASFSKYCPAAPPRGGTPPFAPQARLVLVSQDPRASSPPLGRPLTTHTSVPKLCTTPSLTSLQETLLRGLGWTDPHADVCPLEAGFHSQPTGEQRGTGKSPPVLCGLKQQV